MKTLHHHSLQKKPYAVVSHIHTLHVVVRMVSNSTRTRDVLRGASRPNERVVRVFVDAINENGLFSQVTHVRTVYLSLICEKKSDDPPPISC